LDIFDLGLLAIFILIWVVLFLFFGHFDNNIKLYVKPRGSQSIQKELSIGQTEEH